MKKMLDNWPVEAGRTEGILETFREVYDEVGEDRFRRGVQDIMQSSEIKFFPPVAVFRGYIPAPIGRTWWRNPECPDCFGTGWQEVTPQFRKPDGTWQDREVTRCRNANCLKVEA